MKKNTTILNQLINKQNLTTGETEILLDQIINGKINPTQVAAILIALRMKGEAVDEIVGLVKSMRNKMIRIQAKNAIDVCGTGTDGQGTFNISTTVAFVVAGAGVPVVKHGNRAISGNCGSADVLEQLGMNIHLSAKQAQQVFNKVGMVFLFAPLFHPEIKNLINVRKELKTGTVFNILGPLVNPANVNRQLIGVPNRKIAVKIAQAGKILGYKHLLVVAGGDGLDEISISSNSLLFEVKDINIRKLIINPYTYGIGNKSTKEILGGNKIQNAKLTTEILNGKPGPKRDIVVFNAAYALYAAGVITDIKKGIKLANKSIDNGSAKKILEKLIKETQKYEY